MSESSSAPGENAGLAFWMDRVIEELARAQQDFRPEAVHDLRVALRRCRSIADVCMTLDPHPSWDELKRQARRLFRKLGDLRDVQVMTEWTGTLAADQDSVAQALSHHLLVEELRLRERAGKALVGFNLKKWRQWKEQLTGRTMRISHEDLVLRHLALDRWQEARQLHRQALRNRSNAAFHRLRIGLKRFRYTVEIFLPQEHELWGQDLKVLQDVLGEFHDLHVLWRSALRIGALTNQESRSAWRSRFDKERLRRLNTYREKALGNASVWGVWRAGLPTDDDLGRAAEARLQAWASYRDPDCARTQRLARLALGLYDGLESERAIAPAGSADIRSVLHTAAILRQIGKGHLGRRSRKASYRMIRNMTPIIGYPAAKLQLAALVARHHRGAFPHPDQKDFASLSLQERQGVLLAAAILRLADAFVATHIPEIHRLEVRRTAEAVIISSTGLAEGEMITRKLAAARHPLEVACRAPVLIRPLAKQDEVMLLSESSP